MSYNEFIINNKMKDLKKSYSLNKNNYINIINEKQIMTNNGLYKFKKGIYENVVYIDVKSLLPTVADYLGYLDDDSHEKLLKKHEIDNYIENKQKELSDDDLKSLEKKREEIKLELNIKVSTLNKAKKENNKIRRILVEESTKLMKKIINLFDEKRIVHIINDGFFYVLNQCENINQIKQKLNNKKLVEKNVFFHIQEFNYLIINNFFEYMAYNFDDDKFIIKDKLLTLDKQNCLTDEDYFNQVKQITEIKEEIKNIFFIKKGELSMNLENNMSYQIAKDIKEKYGLSSFLKLPMDNPKYIVVVENDADYITDELRTCYFKFPFTVKDYSNLSNTEMNIETAAFGNIKIKITSNKKQIKGRKQVSNPQLYLMKNDDVRILKKQLINFYINMNKSIKNREINEDDFQLSSDLANVTHLIGFHKGLSIAEIKKIEKEIESTSYISQTSFTFNDIFEMMKIDKNVVKFNNDIYFFSNDLKTWDNSLGNKKLWFRTAFNLLNIDGKMFNKIWKDNEAEIELACLKFMSDTSIKETNELGYLDCNNDFYKINENKELVKSINNDFTNMKFNLDFSKINEITNEDKRKVWALFLHLTNNNEQDAKNLLTAMSSTICLNENLRQMLNVIVLVSGIMGSGKSTLFHLYQRAVGSNICQTKDKINLFENDRLELLDKKAIIFDDVKGLNNPNCVLSSAAGQQLTNYINGDSQTILKKYENSFSRKLLITPFILNNYIPQINQKSVKRRIIIINTEKTIYEDKEFKQIVTEEELKSDKMALTLLMMMIQRLNEIEKIVDDKKINNKDEILSTFYNFNPYKEENLSFKKDKKENKIVWQKEIEDILDYVSADSMDELIGIHLDTFYQEYINFGGNLNKKEIKSIFEKNGYNFGRLSKRIDGKIFGCRNVLLSKDKQKNNQKFNDILEKYPKYYKNTDSVKKTTLSEIKM